MIAGQLQFETEFDWGGTRIVVTTGIVENLRVFFIEPRNGFFATPTVYGRYDDEVSGAQQQMGWWWCKPCIILLSVLLLGVGKIEKINLV